MEQVEFAKLQQNLKLVINNNVKNLIISTNSKISNIYLNYLQV